jgi:glyoxylase-like metal-dependent hydrolase (beta-lactamase superfamily II)/rhodanese-related sulfurtransferase
MQRTFPDLDVDVAELSAADLKRRLDNGEQLTLLDTRRPADFETWHIEHPNLTVTNFEFTRFLDDDGNPAESVPSAVPEGPLVACCAKGISSHYVAAFLARAGRDVMALTDGMEGWATLLEAHPLASGEAADVVQFHRPSSGCLSYLVVAGDEAAVVDPLAAFTEEYEQAAGARGATLRYAIDTHVHADHVSGIRDLADETGGTPVMPAGAVDRGLAIEPTLLAAGETLELGDSQIEAVGLPGHTTEMLGYRVGDVLLTGDTLFVSSVARPDLEDEDKARAAAEQLWETIQMLGTLPEDVVIGPGHTTQTVPGEGDSFSAPLGVLKRRLDAFEEAESAFVERTVTDLPPRPSNFERIIAVNLGQTAVGESEAFTLELGPNNCAVGD